MATVWGVSSANLLSQIQRFTYHSVRFKSHRQNKRPHVYEFLTNKPEMYPGEPCLRTGKLKYYPRDPNYQDPPYQPAKLLMVQRVKPLRGTPWWDVNVLARLGLDADDEDKNHIMVHKNTEYICEELWKVKHLVRVTPITFPNGEPTDEDIERTLLTPDGEMIVSDSVRPDPKRVQAQVDFQKDPLRLDGNTKREHFRHKWNTGWHGVA